MRYLIALLLIVSIESAYSQQNKIIYELSLGIGTGWWIQESNYKIQNETITDWANSRLSLDVPFSASVKYKLGNNIQIGPGFTYRRLMAKNLYASSPIVSSFTKIKIAENSVNAMQYYLSMETSVVRTPKFNLTSRINIGSFQLESIHPDDNFFTNKLMLEAALQISFQSKTELIPFVEMYYSNLTFKSTTSPAYKSVHHIQSIGTKFGLRF